MRIWMLVVAFLWPFVYLWPYVIPFYKGLYLAMGNDFEPLYYRYKVYLLDCLSHGNIPLWSPAEAAGFPFYSSPFAQVFYPLNLPLALFCKLMGGYTTLDHQRFTVLGISIFSLGLFLWLRELKFRPAVALTVAIVMASSMKITELRRFPNAVHSMAWYPWILLMITKILSKTYWRDLARNGVLLCLFCICLLTAGYPYFVYYAIFLIGPYLLLWMIPRCRKMFFSVDTSLKARSWFTLVVSGCTALLVCSPYLYKIAMLMAGTTDRGGNNLGFATFTVFSLRRTIGSLVFPPASQIEGWYYFGISGLFVILLYLFNKTDPGDRIDAVESGRLKKIILIFWIAVVSYITYGEKSYLFMLLWRFMPEFSKLRMWGRLNIILVPIIAWLLAMAYDYFEKRLISLSDASNPDSCRLSRRFKMVLLFSFLSTAIVQTYMLVYRVFDVQWNRFYVTSFASLIKYYARKYECVWLLSPDVLSNIFGGTFLIAGLLAFVVLFALTSLSYRGVIRPGKVSACVCASFLCLSILDVSSVGMWTWTSSFGVKESRRVLDVRGINERSFGVARTDGNKTLPLSDKFSVGTVPNWYFNRYIAFHERTEGELDARNKLLGVVDGTRVYFSEKINHIRILEFLDDAKRFSGKVCVLNYTGDELTLDVEAPVSGCLSFIDNWDQDWRVYVDNRPEKLELLFGTFKSVKLTSGKHKVRFVYEPWSMVFAWK